VRGGCGDNIAKNDCPKTPCKPVKKKKILKKCNFLIDAHPQTPLENNLPLGPPSKPRLLRMGIDK